MAEDTTKLNALQPIDFFYQLGSKYPRIIF